MAQAMLVRRLLDHHFPDDPLCKRFPEKKAAAPQAHRLEKSSRPECDYQLLRLVFLGPEDGEKTMSL